VVQVRGNVRKSLVFAPHRRVPAEQGGGVALPPARAHGAVVAKREAQVVLLLRPQPPPAARNDFRCGHSRTILAASAICRIASLPGASCGFPRGSELRLSWKIGAPSHIAMDAAQQYVGRRTKSANSILCRWTLGFRKTLRSTRSTPVRLSVSSFKLTNRLNAESGPLEYRRSVLRLLLRLSGPRAY
jgi:hypothetical protein